MIQKSDTFFDLLYARAPKDLFKDCTAKNIPQRQEEVRRSLRRTCASTPSP